MLYKHNILKYFSKYIMDQRRKIGKYFELYYKESGAMYQNLTII